MSLVKLSLAAMAFATICVSAIIANAIYAPLPPGPSGWVTTVSVERPGGPETVVRMHDRGFVSSRVD